MLTLLDKLPTNEVIQLYSTTLTFTRTSMYANLLYSRHTARFYPSGLYADWVHNFDKGIYKSTQIVKNCYAIFQPRTSETKHKMSMDFTLHTL